MKMWLPVKTKKFGVAVYNWPGDVRNGLPLEIGDTVEILEEYAGWYRGRRRSEETPWGIFPASLVRETGGGGTGSVTAETEPLVAETAAVLRDWGRFWKKLYVENEVYRFETVRKVMCELLTARRALMAGALPRGPAEVLRNQIAAKLDWGNRKLGLELVPREGSRAVQPGQLGAVRLYRVHLASADSVSTGTLRRQGSHGGSTIGSSISGSINSGLGPTCTTSVAAAAIHLWCCVRECSAGGPGTGQPAQALLSLYDARRQTFVSERFLVRLEADGFSNYLDRLHTNCSIFTDLGNTDMTKEIYLVAQIVRVGRILSAEGAKKGGLGGADGFRRPLGGGVLQLAELLSSSQHQDEREYTFKLYQCDEKDFHQLHELVIKKQSNKYSPLSGHPNFGMVVSLRLIRGDAATIGAVSGGTSPTGAVRACKLGFPDVIMPGDIRNDLFITLERGEFERGGKPTPKNVLASISVFDSDGTIIEECVWSAAGAGGGSQHDAPLLYHNNQPVWQEALRLAVPLDKFPSAHLRIDFRHCSTRDKGEKKIFGFAFARLMEEGGATISDGAHELYIYKCEDPARLTTACYLNLPSSSKDVNYLNKSNIENHTFSRSSKEVVVIKSLLCSTKLTQNSDLLALLQWRAYPDKVQETLLRVLQLADSHLCEELVKFLQDVLDALFALFSTEDGNSTIHSGTVFFVLVSIFSLLDESKFQHFKPVMDAYIDSHFAAALVYKGLLSSVQHCAEWALSTENQDRIRKCFRSLGVILRLAVQSRRLFARATGGQYEDSFRRDLRAAAAALATMLRLPPTEAIMPTQISLLASCGAVVEQVGEALGGAEGARAGAALLDAPQPGPPPALARARLKAAKQLVSTNIFMNDQESRNILIAAICRHVRTHLSRRDELEECADLLGEMLSALHDVNQEANALSPAHLDTLCMGVFDAIIDSLLHLVGRNTPILGSLTSCLLGLLELVEGAQLTKLCDSLAYKPLKDFLMRTFLLFTNLIELEIFPSDWLLMRVSGCAALLRGLQLLAPPLPQRFLGPDPPFDPQVWSAYLGAMVRFLRQPALQVESWGRGWRAPLLRAHGDLRVPAALHLLSMWSHLGDQKLVLAGEMVGPLLEVTLVAELRRAALGALVELMARERAAAGHARRLEAALVDRLDTLLSDNKADDEYRRLFNTMLMERVQAEEGGWREAGAAFVGCVTRLLERLLDYRAVLQGEENRDKRMACTVNLLNFYKNEIDRKELYLRYIYRLHDLHLTAENYTEAGYTMKLYADMLSWDSKNTVADPNHPNTPEWERKEMLYHKILQYFDRGKCWEAGIPLCKELADLYETRLYDYGKLAHVLRTRARFHENILTQLRPDPEYFRVGYYGQGFPLFVRNKQFVYRGLEYERIGAFTARLQAEFPSAQILMKNTPPDDSLLNSDGQYIQISNVRGVAAVGAGGLGSNAPEVLTRHYQAHHLRTFHCDRPKHKGTVDKDNEFKTLWIERTTLVIENELPGILRWSEVIQRSIEEIAPIQYACETMEAVEKELRQLVTLYTAEPSKNINPFSMRLQGIIDANVMGGPSKYQEAFLCDEFLQTWPSLSEEVHRLRTLLGAQARLLEAALALHGRLAPPSVQPLHRRLLERFGQLKQSLGPVARLKRQQSESIVNTPLPPLPVVERRSQSLQSDHADGTTYEDSHLYTKPIYSSESSGCLSPPSRPLRLSREMESGILSNSPPPPPDGEASAPPLPPRLSGCDKRASIDSIPPKIPKRGMKQAPPADNNTRSPTPDLRDSGISTASLSELTGALNNLSYEDCNPVVCRYNSDSRDFNGTPDLSGGYASATSSSFKLDQFLNIIPDSEIQGEDEPPPIPPKVGALEKSDSAINNLDPYLMAKMKLHENNEQ